ncbi:MAG: 4-hydroxythreonine-4-phosphate dehydrogenase PdxA [Verrucomicrobiia bacterium]
MKPTIAITLGDLGGVGPEVVAKALQSGKLPRFCDYKVLGKISKLGAKTSRGAQIAWDALEEGVAGCLSGKFQALVTGPVCKETLAKRGFPFVGQTEFLAKRCGLKEDAVTMAMVSEKLNVFLVSTHVSLRQAIGLITQTKLERTICHALSFLKKIKKTPVRLTVAGLNPHAGEGGLIGREEQEKIQPWLKSLSKKLGLPLPLLSADTLFYQAAQGKYDGVIALYHDQGLIPFKMVAFETGVNCTLGLPFLRTSPDHGTAFDIASCNRANPQSMIAAIQLAAKWVKETCQR